jgi:hypothetical protein
MEHRDISTFTAELEAAAAVELPEGVDCPSVVYHLDDARRITWVNDAWTEFAVASGSPQLAAIVGEPLWRHVKGAEVKAIYEAVFARVVRGGRPAVMPLRCDAPDRSRVGNLTVRRLESGELEVASRLRAGRRRSPLRLVDPDAPRDPHRQILMCAWCKRVEDKIHGVWREPEEVVLAMRLFEAPTLPSISHGICPVCEASVI